jgi:serine/threonine protein kinase
METLHQPNDTINQRYRIVTPLGQGSMGTTYEAEDLTNYQRVAIKAVSLRQATDWKILELFEREARVLANLNHAKIPNYFDYFQIETPEEIRFYLVRELIEGESLATLIEQNWQPTETQVKDIGIQVLKILEYPHSFTPPVIHRDIKPQNIIRRPDGQVYLVDFGAVQDVYRNTLTRGGTFVGTLGYMPLEQFRGQVKPASDLYSFGASLLFLLTGKSPADLPQVRMRIDWRSQVNISADFGNWLEKMLEPTLEDRFQSAKEALNALSLPKFEAKNLPGFSTKNPPPRGSDIKVEISHGQTIIYIPPGGWGCLVVLGILGLIILSPFIYSLSLLVISEVGVIIYAIASALFVGVLGYNILWAVFGSTRIEINPETLSIESELMDFKRKVVGAKTFDIEKVEVEVEEKWVKSGKKMRKKTIFRCVIWEGIRKHQFGQGMSREVQDWLVAEMSDIVKFMQS